MGKAQTILLAQGRTFDHRRLKEKMGELGLNEVGKVWQGYRRLH